MDRYIVYIVSQTADPNPFSRRTLYRTMMLILTHTQECIFFVTPPGKKHGLTNNGEKCEQGNEIGEKKGREKD